MLSIFGNPPPELPPVVEMTTEEPAPLSVIDIPEPATSARSLGNEPVFPIVTYDAETSAPEPTTVDAMTTVEFAPLSVIEIHVPAVRARSLGNDPVFPIMTYAPA
jgi:hypothetical protein